MPNTGKKAYSTLEEYFIDTGDATGVTKPNVDTDPDYVAPVTDTVMCPVLTQINMSGAYTSSSAACNGSPVNNYWFSGGGELPTSSSVIYTDSSGNSTFNGSSQWYHFFSVSSSNENVGMVSTNGGVSFAQDCAAPATLSVSPGYKNVTSNYQTFTLTISCNTTWTITDNVSWLSSSPTSGSGNGSSTITVQSNSGGVRFGTITVSANGGEVADMCDVDQDAFSGGGPGEPGCLIDGTMVTMSDGSTRPIESLKVGDEILSPKINDFEDTNDVRELYKVELDDLVFKNEVVKVKNIINMERPVTYSINNGLLRATGEHSQLVKREVWKFIPLGNISVGDILMDSDNNEIVVDSIERFEAPVNINKLTLEGPQHTFYANDIITHNVKEPV
jgi:hypothetical protein